MISQVRFAKYIKFTLVITYIVIQDILKAHRKYEDAKLFVGHLSRIQKVGHLKLYLMFYSKSYAR